jgi:uncharacterized membrane protein
MEVATMEPSPPAAPPLATRPASTTAAKAVYILYLASFLVGVTALVGVVVAYVHAGEAPEPLRSHHRFQIRTFWIGLLYTALAAILSLFVVGLLFLGFVAVWLVVRCVKGLKYLARGEPYPRLETWLW